MDLREYRRKRKFGQTPEPKGKLSRRKGPLRFVIQKHEATRTHFDFRLELEGVLKSWAVPKGPSLSPLDQRLAVHVEDHPMEYGSFEGVIPKGNYGAGTVMLWDCGTYVSRQNPGRAESEKILMEGLAAGRLTFVLSGEKLTGEFALIRLKGKDPKAWLLIKKRDHSAMDKYQIPEDDLSVSSGRTMKEISAQSVRKKDVWIPGKGSLKKLDPIKTKKVQKKPVSRSENKMVSMPHSVRAMQAVVSLTLPEDSDWLFELDYQGHRAVAEVDSGKVRLYSRSLLNLENKFPSVVAALEKLKGTLVLDGQILDEKNGQQTPCYVVSDLLFVDGRDLRNEPLSVRKRQLQRLNFKKRPLVAAKDFSDWKQVEAAAKKEKVGGILAKKKESVYQSGLGRDWLRLKSGVTAAGARKNLRSHRQISDEKPPLTHPNKIYWPEEGYTKGDVVQYYERVSQWILPHLIDRPQSLHRQPDGVRSEGFFHKDMVGYIPRRVKTIPVRSDSSQKTIHYLLCQDLWTLLYMANLGCIELNPWLSRVKSLDKPDYFAIDIDPDENDFEDVIKIALEVRRVLKSFGVESFCKTSGSTGMHVCVPTGAKYSYDEVRDFAQGICSMVLTKFPNLTSMERNPARRKGKIYLDFLQNRRSQTLAAPYCLRPRRKATVSCPLKWTEVKSGLTPEAFTIETMPKRLERVGDLWQPMLGKGENLDRAMKQLLKKRHTR